MEGVKEDVALLTPLKKIDNLLIINKGGAQPIILDKYIIRKLQTVITAPTINNFLI